MSFAQLHWPSQVLGRQTTTWVLLPDQGTGPFPALYLLHGLSDDHTIWMRQTRLESYVAGKPLMIVMPDGGRGFYANHHDGGPQWATHFGVELSGMIERIFPAIPTRAGRFIGGLSMGGFGSLRIALGYPDRFSSVTCHSGAVLGPGRRKDLPPSKEWKSIVGPIGWENSGNDLTPLAKQAATVGLLPRMKIDCGIDDFLLDDNRLFHKQLADAGIAHDYVEHPGGHNWDYWDLHVRDAIDFHLRQ